MPNPLTQKYPHLEISVLKLSEVLHDNPTKRMDAEYFKREYVNVKERLNAIPSEYLRNLVSFNARYPQPTYDVNSTLKIINSQHVRNESINYENARTGYGAIVPKEAVLINSTGVGTLGRVFINLLDFDFSIDNHINVLVVRDKSKLLPSFLMVFLQTSFGQFQINRYYSGTSGQIEIYPRDFNNFLIPLLPLPFQEHIAHLVQSAHHALEQSKSLYKEAQELLEQELGTLPPAPPKEHQIKSLKESFLTTGRLDAEFYQHRYAQIEDLIKNYKGGVCTLEASEICDTPFEPQPNTRYRYIELAHIGNYGNITTFTEALGAHLPTRARRLAQSSDVLLSSIEGSLSACALVPPHLSPCVVSTGFFVLRSKRFNPETLLSLFKSPLFQTYLAKFASGTILCAISKSALQSVLLPKIPAPLQERIAQCVQESLDHRQTAKTLLMQAKNNTEEALSREREREREREIAKLSQRAVFSTLKAHLKRARHLWRYAQWLLLETLLLNQKNYSIKTLQQSLRASGRLDAEYYQEKYEKLETHLKGYANGVIRLKDLVREYSSGFAFKSEDYLEQRQPDSLMLIRINNIKRDTLESHNVVYLPSYTKNLSPKDKLSKGDLLISMSGSVGLACVVLVEIEAMLNQRILKIKVKDFIPEVLALYLNSAMGRLQFEHIGTGGVQTNISYADIQNMLIPKIPLSTQEQIATHLQRSFKLRQEAKTQLDQAKLQTERALTGGGGGEPSDLSHIKALLKQAKEAYQRAQKVLAKTLFTPKNYSIKTLQQSLRDSKRLDAEYYQEKYAANQARLQARPHARLHELVEIKKSIEPGSGAYKSAGVPFVRVGNLSPFGMSPAEVFLSPSLELESLYPQKDEVLFSKDGTIGIAYCVPHTLEVVLSGAILRLAIKDKSQINPHYLALVLNHQSTQLQTQRESIGSIIAHLSVAKIAHLLIPLLPFSTQERIAQKLQTSFDLRRQAEQQLEQAKLEIEQALVSK
ncbi:restriction endonuclease subunit S [Helicobacter labacensis]|uniref:restriction endonuclease subunit S n=1 Tax=Helicobacter labacensis TaxID=2316079 RepID=UPI0013CDE0E2|nr:restriction endonuclease subunit S [Helicobacter labacensis]